MAVKIIVRCLFWPFLFPFAPLEILKKQKVLKKLSARHINSPEIYDSRFSDEYEKHDYESRITLFSFQLENQVRKDVLLSTSKVKTTRRKEKSAILRFVRKTMMDRKGASILVRNLKIGRSEKSKLNVGILWKKKKRNSKK